jgi:3-phenylpropionate/trans-cinnamate dioxygenase ferredoxin reductase subunit
VRRSGRKAITDNSPSRRGTSRLRRIVVVGAGDCGTRVALALRRGGWEGALTLVGDEAVAPYERPPLSKATLAEPDAAPPPITRASEMAELAIEWEPKRAAARIDRSASEVVLADGHRVAYDRLLLSTGARARRPSVPGAEVVLTLRSYGDAVRLRGQLCAGTRLFVMGGGFIGLEVAATAADLGCQVTVVEFAHRLMSRVVPAKVAELVRARHADAGVDIRCGVGVDRIESRENTHHVVLTDGSRVEADVVMAGIGAVPNTELGAAAGLTVANGIRVDEHLCTDDPAIYAAGDCCSFPHPLYGGTRVRIEAWKNALDHADVATRNLLGDDAVCETVPWFWSDQYELGLQIAGLHEQAAYDVVRSRDDGTEIRFGLDNDGRVVSASGVAVGSAISRDISLAEVLIARRATPRPTELANPTVNLRELVRAAS